MKSVQKPDDAKVAKVHAPKSAKPRDSLPFAQWGKAKAPMGNYTVWPTKLDLRRANRRFTVALNGDYTTHRLMWSSSSVSFQSLHGHHDDNNSNQFGGWQYQPQDPSSYVSQRAMPVHMNLRLFQGQPPANGHEVEIIVRSFKFRSVP